MMDGEKLSPIGAWDLANSKKINLKDTEFESGMHLLKVTIREGTRITIAGLHAQAAREIGQAMIEWADAND